MSVDITPYLYKSVGRNCRTYHLPYCQCKSATWSNCVGYFPVSDEYNGFPERRPCKTCGTKIWSPDTQCEECQDFEDDTGLGYVKYLFKRRFS